jgi:hypothetical protein
MMSIFSGEVSKSEDFIKNPSNIYQMARECYPMIYVDNCTDWEQERHNYFAEILILLEKKYPTIFKGIKYDDAITVIHKKDFGTLDFSFSDEFIKKVSKEYPEALV